MIIWLQCYAFFWMLLTSYMAYTTLNRSKRINRANDMIENGHIYERMLAVVSPRVLIGILAAMELFVVAVDSYGFLLSFVYVPLEKWQQSLFVVVVLAYFYECLRSFSYIKNFRRVFERPDPFRLLARYLRYCISAGHPTVYIAAYGKCLIAVKLFLTTITPGLELE